MATLYWHMTVDDYFEYAECAAGVMAAEQTGDTDLLQSYHDRLQRIPRRPSSTEHDLVIPVVDIPSEASRTALSQAKPLPN